MQGGLGGLIVTEPAPPVWFRFTFDSRRP